MLAGSASSVTSDAKDAPPKRSSSGPLEPAVSSKRAMSKLWDNEEVLQFSKLIYHFKALHGRLPDTADREFWLNCCKHFNGCFTSRQLRRKMLHLKLRYEQISSGRAKTIKVGEKPTLHLWNGIVTCNIVSAKIAGAVPPLPIHSTSKYSYTITLLPDGPLTFPQAAPLWTAPTSSAGGATFPPLPEDQYGQARAASTPAPKNNHQAKDEQTAGFPFLFMNFPKTADDAGNEVRVAGSMARGAEEQHIVEGSSTLRSAVNNRMQGQHDNINFQHNFMLGRMAVVDQLASTIKEVASTTKKEGSTTNNLAKAICTLAGIVESNGPPK